MELLHARHYSRHGEWGWNHTARPQEPPLQQGSAHKVPLRIYPEALWETLPDR